MNFDFLKPFKEFEHLYTYCTDAEDLVNSKPSLSATSARKANEFLVKMLYVSKVPYADSTRSVFDMLEDYSFKQLINDETVISAMHYIRKIGNRATHGEIIDAEASNKVLEILHYLVGEICVNLKFIENYPDFEKPTAAGNVVELKEPAAEPVVISNEVVAKIGTKLANASFDFSPQHNEDVNKEIFLKASFADAGWPMVTVPNQALPGCIGFNIMLDDGSEVDYVMYGRDNKPLAIFEYSVTKTNVFEGRMKAIHQAELLEKKYGYKPVIYYTSGYKTYVIDQLGYKPRRVFTHHSIEELERMKTLASQRKDISDPVIDDNITNREYQKNAIRAVCKAFSDMRRKSLLVMATGTGKTRISISLVDILTKANWAKNILFLADRTTLVRQACKNFNKLLPSITTSVYTGQSMNRDPNARVIFSTYQTMIGLINDETREFGIGRFDLIIVDEAHRSIFKKYGALFSYFDALMIGLTATPRAEDNKSTYETFEVPDQQPDYAYELQEAVSDGFLVGFSVEDRTTDIQMRGVRYDDLSDAEKQSIEDAFATGDSDISFEHSVIEADRFNRKARNAPLVINRGTIRQMLNDLMNRGLRVNDGDLLGKTIIFAKSHNEAEIIVEEFQRVYNTFDPDFCKLIDAKTVNSQGLIDQFEERDKFPQIAVSVDMLDTGVDVPDVLNLVFYKQVKSKIKFLQMVGRGTRLCKDIYGPGQDKNGFMILDYGDNFNYFSVNNTWSTINERANAASKMNIMPISMKLNIDKFKLYIALGIYKTKSLSGEEAAVVNEKFEELRNYFITKTQSLNNDDINVIQQMPYVNKYRSENEWNLPFTKMKEEEIENILIPLFPAEHEPVQVKKFDNAVYTIARIMANKKLISNASYSGNARAKETIHLMMQELKKLTTIPEIIKNSAAIDWGIKQTSLENEDMIKKFKLSEWEDFRKKVQPLVKFIPTDNPCLYVVNIEDGDGCTMFGSAFMQKNLSQCINEYLSSGSLPVLKIKSLDKLTDFEKEEIEKEMKGYASDQEFLNVLNGKTVLQYARSVVGISDDAIDNKFGAFLNLDVLTGEQYAYMQTIIDYVKVNGNIAFTDLQRQPFPDIDISQLFGTNIIHIKTLVKTLREAIE